MAAKRILMTRTITICNALNTMRILYGTKLKDFITNLDTRSILDHTDRCIIDAYVKLGGTEKYVDMRAIYNEAVELYFEYELDRQMIIRGYILDEYDKKESKPFSNHLKMFVRWINDTNPARQQIVDKVTANSKACCGAIALHNTLRTLNHIPMPEADIYVTLSNTLDGIKYLTNRDIYNFTNIDDVRDTLKMVKSK